VKNCLLPAAAGYWILDTGFWFAGLNTGHFVKNCLLPTAAGFWKLDTGYWILETRHFVKGLPAACCNCLLPLHTGNRTFCEKLPTANCRWILDSSGLSLVIGHWDNL
jgi:hypothetical protein